MYKRFKTGTLTRSASRTEIRTTDLTAVEITVDQQDDNHEVQKPTDWPAQRDEITAHASRTAPLQKKETFPGDVMSHRQGTNEVERKSFKSFDRTKEPKPFVRERLETNGSKWRTTDFESNLSTERVFPSLKRGLHANSKTDSKR
ncbi:hypothetical protein AVEN_195274-1 [Araneus ventricosus]|uniref:Uncharacterized protein n=1 Tax=Araneus ventricosus TaxID=182803 RepID=A0A4Y2FXQ9_ARAVE|nr:hypothetical protein AVEN_195274-1 [Araneus ventricosus]